MGMWLYPTIIVCTILCLMGYYLTVRVGHKIEDSGEERDSDILRGILSVYRRYYFLLLGTWLLIFMHNRTNLLVLLCFFFACVGMFLSQQISSYGMIERENAWCKKSDRVLM